MSARRARPRRRVRTTENVEPTAVQEEEPAGPWRDASDIYGAVRAACLGTAYLVFLQRARITRSDAHSSGALPSVVVD